MEGDTNAESNIKDLCPCRENEVSALLKLMGDNVEFAPPSIFIHGHKATGKTYVMKTILSKMDLPHAMVNCIESYTSKLIFHEILRVVCDDGINWKTCGTMMDFTRILKQSSLQEVLGTFYIVLDHADRLRSMEPHLIPAFSSLMEITELDVSVVFISELPPEKFLQPTGMHPLMSVYFPNYSKSDLATILSLDTPEHISTTFYGQYIQILLDVFGGVCRDLKELKHLASLNFKKYYEPVEQGKVAENDVRKLWKEILPQLKHALQTVYLHTVSSSQWEAMQESNCIETALATGSVVVKNAVELPYYSKYLLIAAFMASYNPATCDRRFFTKKRFDKMTKRTKHSIKSAKNADKKFLGPKAFPLDRLMAIFYSIVEGGAAPSAIILSQISSLVTLNLLIKVSADEQIETSKYKCVVTYDFAAQVAKQVDFDLVQYLYDT